MKCLLSLVLCSPCSMGMAQEDLVLRTYETGSLTRALQIELPRQRFGVHCPLPGAASLSVPEYPAARRILTPGLLEEYLRSRVPDDAFEPYEARLDVREAYTVVTATPGVQREVERALDELRAALREATHQVTLRWYVGEATHDVQAGILTPEELSAVGQHLREHARLALDVRFDATPWDEHVIDQRVSRRVLLDADVEVAEPGPFTDPVVDVVRCGPWARVRVTPLESSDRVLLHLDFDDSRFLELRSYEANAGHELRLHLEFPAVVFQATCQCLPITLGGGAVIPCGSGPSAGVLFVRVGSMSEAVDRDAKTDVAFLQTQALCEARERWNGLPYGPWRVDMPPDPSSPLVTPEDLTALHDVLETGDTQYDELPWMPLMELSPERAERLRTWWKDLERELVQGVEFEVSSIETPEARPPGSPDEGQLVARQTLIALDGVTSRTAFGMEMLQLVGWDVETASGHHVGDPLVDSEFDGTWVTVRPYEIQDDVVRFRLEWYERHPAGETRVIPVTKTMGPLELPNQKQAAIRRELRLHVGESAWLGTVPGAECGKTRHAFVRVKEVVR
ncbi:MAG: hypothetical protein H6834_09310 [Planctomycetes bacterium]|nr:hypothetical protein [Planctomycetota bacterium]